MPRTILITAGTSILDNLQRPEIGGHYDKSEKLRNRLPSQRDMAELLDSPNGKEWAGKASGAGGGGQTGAWWFIDYYGRKSPKDDAKVHAAELASLRLLSPTPEDEIIFLCSDTPPGLFCGLVVAHLIKERNDPIRFHEQATADVPMTTREVNWGWEITERHVPHTDMPRAGGGKVSMWQIPGLNPVSRREFEERGAGNLVRTFIRLARAAKVKGHPFVVNFTGGYKATIPLLTLVASWMGSPDVSMVALYQESNELLRIPIADSQPSDDVWREVSAIKNDSESTMAEVRTGLRRYFKDRPHGGRGLEWSLLGEALDIFFNERERPAA